MKSIISQFFSPLIPEIITIMHYKHTKLSSDIQFHKFMEKHMTYGGKGSQKRMETLDIIEMIPVLTVLFSQQGHNIKQGKGWC